MISISYSLEEEFLSFGEKQRFTENAMSLGLMGSTIVAVSGDNGAVTWRAKTNANECHYRPLHPASDPYVVSVGATQVYSFACSCDDVLNATTS
jgi:subtilase family serine protease